MKRNETFKVMVKSGVYRIKNIIDNKVYIGSAINIKRRWCRHRQMLNERIHHCNYLQNAWNKYNSENFIFEIIEEIKDKTNLLQREQYYLDNIQDKYNTNPTAGNRLGVKQTLTETKKRVNTRRNNGKPWVSEQQRRKMKLRALGNKYHLNKPHTEETKKLLSLKKKEQCSKPEWREHMRQINLGNTNRKGKKTSEEGLNKLRKPVVQKDFNGNVIETYKGVLEATKTTGITGIANCLTGRSKSAGKYKWEYDTTN
jgi:group I intron endonuclease